MSNVENIRPAHSTGFDGKPANGAADAYSRAVQARPTAFAENPIGAMAGAVDRIGRAAGNLRPRGETTAEARAERSQARFAASLQQAGSQPRSVAAKQAALTAGLTALRDLQTTSPSDPRRVRIAQHVVQLANQLGAQGIPTAAGGLDVLGLLRLATALTSRFGDAAGMQQAFALEQMLKGMLSGSSAEALGLRDELLRRFNIRRAAAQMIADGWKVRLAGAGQLPSVDVSARTISLQASQQNASLAVLAKAFWHDAGLSDPGGKDGFIKAFLKIANQGSVPVLHRKYREVRSMARHTLSATPAVTAVGTGTGAPLVTAARREDESDEGSDMFAALAVFSRSDSGQVPESVQPALSRFFA